VVPFVWARLSTWQAPHLDTKSRLPEIRLALPSSDEVAEQALSATAAPVVARAANAARKRLLERSTPIGAGLYPLARTSVSASILP
jgi:hypothetical protein